MANPSEIKKHEEVEKSLENILAKDRDTIGGLIKSYNEFLYPSESSSSSVVLGFKLLGKGLKFAFYNFADIRNIYSNKDVLASAEFQSKMLGNDNIKDGIHGIITENNKEIVNLAQHHLPEYKDIISTIGEPTLDMLADSEKFNDVINNVKENYLVTEPDTVKLANRLLHTINSDDKLREAIENNTDKFIDVIELPDNQKAIDESVGNQDLAKNAVRMLKNLKSVERITAEVSSGKPLFEWSKEVLNEIRQNHPDLAKNIVSNPGAVTGFIKKISQSSEEISEMLTSMKISEDFLDSITHMINGNNGLERLEGYLSCLNEGKYFDMLEQITERMAKNSGLNDYLKSEKGSKAFGDFAKGMFAEGGMMQDMVANFDSQDKKNKFAEAVSEITKFALKNPDELYKTGQSLNSGSNVSAGFTMLRLLQAVPNKGKYAPVISEFAKNQFKQLSPDNYEKALSYHQDVNAMVQNVVSGDYAKLNLAKNAIGAIGSAAFTREQSKKTSLSNDLQKAIEETKAERVGGKVPFGDIIKGAKDTIANNKYFQNNNLAYVDLKETSKNPNLFKDVDLTNVDMIYSKIQNVSFESANLDYTYISASKISAGCNFSQAKINNSRFVGCEFIPQDGKKEVSFKDAHIQNTNFDRIKISDGINLNFDGACIDANSLNSIANVAAKNHDFKNKISLKNVTIEGEVSKEAVKYLDLSSATNKDIAEQSKIFNDVQKTLSNFADVIGKEAFGVGMSQARKKEVELLKNKLFDNLASSLIENHSYEHIKESVDSLLKNSNEKKSIANSITKNTMMGKMFSNRVQLDSKALEEKIKAIGKKLSNNMSDSQQVNTMIAKRSRQHSLS